MTTYALTDCKLYTDQYDLTGDTNAMDLKADTVELDSTTFASAGWKEVLPGLEMVEFKHSGFISVGEGSVDEVLNTGLGVNTTIVSVGHTTGAVGEPAYMMKKMRTSVERGAQVGELYGFQAVGKGSTRLVRGYFLYPKTATTETDTGTAVEVGAASASQKVYAALHVFAASGTDETLDVVVQSDDGSGFASPTSRITFAQATGVTSEWKELSGAVTDTFWRVSYTIAGTDPSFTFAVTLGIR